MQRKPEAVKRGCVKAESDVNALSVNERRSCFSVAAVRLEALSGAGTG